MAEPRILLESPQQSKEEPSPRRRSTWGEKFRVAFRGIKLGVRGESSFFVHFFCTALVLVAAVILRCDLTQWCILLGCIGMVLTAELFNSAIETLFHNLDEETRNRAWPCLDIAAGAVLMASIFACIIGALVLLSQFALLLNLMPK